MITTLVGSTTLYFSVRRWLRQRQAWQWWHQHQTNRLHAQAESIRDDLLQQTFAFRRFLESSLDTQPQAEQTEQWVKRCQTLYRSLEQLSDQLSPPFIGDSLPLALQFTVQTWQQSHPGIGLRLNVPNDWPAPTTNHNPIILSMVNGLIEALFTNDQDSHYQLLMTLERQDNRCTLTLEQIKSQVEDQMPPNNATEIDHLKEIFRSLTAGSLEVSPQTTGWKGQLCWQEP